MRAVPLAEAPEVSVALDVRSADFVGDTHYVVLRGLAPSTTYQLVIEGDDSGGPLGDDRATPYLFQTGPAFSAIPPPPNLLAGKVRDTDGAAGEGCLLFVRLSDGDRMGSSGDSARLSALTEPEGKFLVALHARTADLRSLFDYQIG
ncbi:MAG: hypothetical protein HYY04_08525 [Chloroflexi bacterium]|nr:hypothetical protein [Chloroflexota bacterium]